MDTLAQSQKPTREEVFMKCRHFLTGEELDILYQDTLPTREQLQKEGCELEKISTFGGKYDIFIKRIVKSRIIVTLIVLNAICTAGTFVYNTCTFLSPHTKYVASKLQDSANDYIAFLQQNIKSEQAQPSPIQDDSPLNKEIFAVSSNSAISSLPTLQRG